MVVWSVSAPHALKLYFLTEFTQSGLRGLQTRPFPDDKAASRSAFQSIRSKRMIERRACYGPYFPIVCPLLDESHRKMQ